MSKKKASSKARTHYFAHAREYQRILEAEYNFFKGMVAAKNSIPGDPTIQKALRDVTSFLQDSGRPLEVEVEFAVADPRDGVTRSLLLGTQIKPPLSSGQAQATYYLCLVHGDSLLCKFHVDFDFHTGAPEKKPSPHVQFGGRVPPSLRKKACKCTWDEALDKPRMPTLPMCTALLWHWAFLEYQHEELMSAFLKSISWRKLIKEAEIAILTPFFEDGERFLSQHPERGLFNSLYNPTETI